MIQQTAKLETISYVVNLKPNTEFNSTDNVDIFTFAGSI